MNPGILLRSGMMGAPTAPGEARRPALPPRAPEDLVLAELDAVVKSFHRRSALRRLLRGAGGLFTRLLKRAVPPGPPRSGPPPEMRFPFF